MQRTDYRDWWILVALKWKRSDLGKMKLVLNEYKFYLLKNIFCNKIWSLGGNSLFFFFFFSMWVRLLVPEMSLLRSFKCIISETGKCQLNIEKQPLCSFSFGYFSCLHLEQSYESSEMKMRKKKVVTEHPNFGTGGDVALGKQCEFEQDS